ncbi:MAG: hypothetical protein J1E63_06095 [Muribaculaceae bacterium]|nr:hypothetical protein [Muribaculaceae bacterium]
MRKINISNDAKRNAEVAFGSTFHRPSPIFKTADGRRAKSERRVRTTLATADGSLISRFADGLADALIAGDPEIDMEQFGKKIEGIKRVYLTPEGKVAYGVTLSEHIYLPDGTEKEVRPEQTTEANIALNDVPLRWTGKLIPRKQALRMFVFKKSYQIQHINSLTYDFLFDMAKKLADADSMMLVGAGPKGVAPLVMVNGGTPYRAFLEGRVNGDKYVLILRLTNLELKSL